MMRFFSSRVFVIGTLVCTVAFGSGLARAYYQQLQLHREITALQTDIDELKKKKLDSIALLSYVMSPVFAEEKARIELNMKRPGERVAVVQTDPAFAPGRGETEDDAGQNLSNPLQWWYYFFPHSL